MYFVSKDQMSSLRKSDSELSESFFQEVTAKGITSHYVKYPFTVAGWYVVADKAGTQLINDWEEAFEEASQETKEKTPTAKPEAKKATKGKDTKNLLKEYATLCAKNKKSAKDKGRITEIEKLIS